MKPTLQNQVSINSGVGWRKRLHGPKAHSNFETIPWSLFLWPPLLLTLVLLVIPQALFIFQSFFRSDGLGGLAGQFNFDNYVSILSDPFYLRATWQTFILSALATLVVLVIALPTAYSLARMPSWLASNLIVLLLMTSFVTVVVKIPGLSLLLSQHGVVNEALISLGLLTKPIQMIDNDVGVVIGLVQYTLAFLVLTLFAVLQTIPRSLEDAAEIHGASWLSSMTSVVLPLAKPGIIAGTLITFNMNMGAFTSAVLLGGGKVLTLPILIQRKIILDVDYPMGAALSTVLLVFTVVINLLSTYAVRGRKLS